jgi:hypothetical protein
VNASHHKGGKRALQRFVPTPVKHVKRSRLNAGRLRSVLRMALLVVMAMPMSLVALGDQRASQGRALFPKLTCSPAPCVFPNVVISGGHHANETPIAVDPQGAFTSLGGSQ